MLPLFQLPHTCLERHVFIAVTATPLFTLIFFTFFFFSNIFITNSFCLCGQAGEEKAGPVILGIACRHLGIDPD